MLHSACRTLTLDKWLYMLFSDACAWQCSLLSARVPHNSRDLHREFPSMCHCGTYYSFMPQHDDEFPTVMCARIGQRGTPIPPRSPPTNQVGTRSCVLPEPSCPYETDLLDDMQKLEANVNQIVWSPFANYNPDTQTRKRVTPAGVNDYRACRVTLVLCRRSCLN
jgi:hypothetical protein